MTGQNFLKLVDADWENNSSLKQKCLTDARKDLQFKGGWRAFDSIQHLVDQEDLQQLIKEMGRIIRGYNWRESSTNFNDIKNWYNTIIETACSALLNEKGELKETVINKFGWNDLKDKINIMHLVCAFVGGVSQQLYATEDYKNFCRSYPKNFDNVGMAAYMYGQWVRENLHSKNYNFIDDLPERECDAKALLGCGDAKATAIALGVGVGVGLGATALGLLGLFLSSAFKNTDTTSNDYSFRHMP